jgi:hypothetical protein
MIVGLKIHDLYASLLSHILPGELGMASVLHIVNIKLGSFHLYIRLKLKVNYYLKLVLNTVFGFHFSD